MKTHIIILLFSLFFSCDSYKKDNVTDEKIKYKKYYFDSGKLFSEGFIKDTLPVGTWIVYRETGQVSAIKSYNLNGVPDGVWQYFYSNGFIDSYRTYKNDTIHGIEVSYTSKGELIHKRIWKNGKFYGDYEIYYGDSLCQDNSTKYIPDSTGELLSISKCVNCRWVQRKPTLNEIEEYRKQKRK